MRLEGVSCSFAYNGSASAVCNVKDILPAELRPQLTRVEPTDEDKSLVWVLFPIRNNSQMKKAIIGWLFLFGAPGDSAEQKVTKCHVL